MQLEALVSKSFNSEHVLHRDFSLLDFEVLEIYFVVFDVSCFLRN